MKFPVITLDKHVLFFLNHKHKNVNNIKTCCKLLLDQNVVCCGGKQGGPRAPCYNAMVMWLAINNILLLLAQLRNTSQSEKVLEINKQVIIVCTKATDYQ